jgi:hypothetical protein
MYTQMPRPTSRLCKPFAQCCTKQSTTAATCIDPMQLQSSTTSPYQHTSLKPPRCIYEHALLVLVPPVHFSRLLHGSSWFHELLDANNKVCNMNCFTTVIGTEKHNKSEGEAPDKESEARRHMHLEERAAREDLSALYTMRTWSDQEKRNYA